MVVTTDGTNIYMKEKITKVQAMILVEGLSK